MNADYIKSLLNLFYNGETSEKEERILSDYFESENVDGELSPDKDYFFQMKQLKNVEIPGTLASGLDCFFDSIENKGKRNRKNLFYITGSCAAVLIVLLSIGYRLFGGSITDEKPSGITAVQIDCDIDMSLVNNDEQIAIQLCEMAKALEMVSYELNEGLSDLERIDESINSAVEILNNNIKI